MTRLKNEKQLSRDLAYKAGIILGKLAALERRAVVNLPRFNLALTGIWIAHIGLLLHLPLGLT